MQTKTFCKASPRQIGYIWQLAKDSGLDDELLHALVESMTGQVSIAELSKEEAGRIIDRLKNVTEKDIYQYDGRQNRATESQIKKIYSIMGSIVRMTPERGEFKTRLRGYIKKYSGVDDVKFLTTKQASNIILGLGQTLKSIQDKKGK